MMRHLLILISSLAVANGLLPTSGNSWRTLAPFSIPSDRPSQLRLGLLATSKLNDSSEDPLENNNNSNGNSHDKSLATTRRAFLSHSAGAAIVATAAPSQAAVSTATPVVPTPPFSYDLYWPPGKVAFSLLPLAGTYTRRATVETEVIKDTIWTFDQIQGVVNVNVPVRQTVVKLQHGKGLWVHNPVAPTPQLIKRMRELQTQHGPITHIVLGSVALEHKATLGPFAQRFPNATVWLQPGQWSFPAQLPVEFLGVTQSRDKVRELPPDHERQTTDEEMLPEWVVDDFDYEMLGPLKFRSVGAFSETAFFHKSTKTLLVTNAVVSVTEEPPAIIQEDPRAMLFHARDSVMEVVRDTPETRCKGWRRMVQFGLVFFPSQIDVVPFGEALREAREVDPSLRNLGEGAVPLSLYPWTWKTGDADLKNFQAISRNGELFCPPILTKLILDREPRRTLEWVDRVCQRFDFDHVIPCHLNNYVKATPEQFRRAFDPLRSTPDNVVPQRALPEDLALLQKASDLLTRYGVVRESQVCDLEPARTVGRFAKR